MISILAYIFKHLHYNAVMTAYSAATSEYSDALSVWGEYVNLPKKHTFKVKEQIASNLQAIKNVSLWIERYRNFLSSRREGLVWLYHEKGQNGLPNMNYLEYKYVFDNSSRVNLLQSLVDTYNTLIRNNIESVKRYIGYSNLTHSYDEIKKIANSKAEILRIAQIISTAHTCQRNYKAAWQLFSKGTSFESMPLSLLETIKEDDFSTKEAYLVRFSRKPILISLLIGSSLYASDDFSEEAIEQEQEVLMLLAGSSFEKPEEFCVNIKLNDSQKLKRAILNSETYGISCNFSDSFSISQFYELRGQYEIAGVDFDESVNKTKQNEAALKAFHFAQSGNSIYYIEDYLKVMIPGSPIYEFVENYKLEKAERDKAKNLLRNYSKGFIALFGSVNLDSCSISVISNIINSEERILRKNRELEEAERKRLEEERLRHEEELKKQEIASLKSCVSSWPQPSQSNVDCFSLYYYYPTTCPWNASEDEWDVRNLIWDFKANPNRPQTPTEIKLRHERALAQVLPDLVRVIEHFFGQKKSKLTLVCIPSSKRIVTERRYKDLSSQLSQRTGMINGYDYVKVLTDGEAKHLGGSAQAEFAIDSNFFKGKYIVLFDDVITSGRSMEKFKRLLENVGATVICGISIGKTRHERECSNPIDRI